VSASVRIHGIPASPGIAIAKARVVVRQRLNIRRKQIQTGDVPAEKERLRKAVAEARRHIEETLESLSGATQGQGEHALILQAHLLMLDDELLIDGAMSLISTKRICAEWALSQKADEVKRMLAAIGDEYLRERFQDVEFISDRVLRNLLGHVVEIIDRDCPAAPCIIAANDISPDETANMVLAPVLGFCTEAGTRTSHTAIMAQSLGIPAVVGAPRLTEHVEAGDTVIVDGLEGVVVVRPNADELAEYERRAHSYAALESRMRATRDDPVVTTDGIEAQLLANIELPGEAPLAVDYGAAGIGLYRTEFLFLDRDKPPSEDEQFDTYTALVRSIGSKPVVFRTFDLGADKMMRGAQNRERNPALGLRAIRLGLKEREMFTAQLRALLRAARVYEREGAEPLKILLPMVSGVEEVREIKGLLVRERDALGAAAGDVQIGCMIEVPAAVMCADFLAREVDFFSIGTNDLIQFCLAIDRSNDQVAYLYTPYHPALLRAVAKVIAAAKDRGIPVAMCGGAASEPLMAPLLFGLGLRIFSVPPTQIPFVRAALRSFSSAEAAELATKALALCVPSEIERLAERFMRPRLNDAS
jgi:phosphoenolpyruvate-protein phosphotransferase (PTS system enzyme I)